MPEPAGPSDRRLAEALFALFLARSHKADRELFDKLCHAHPDLREHLKPMYRTWSRMRSVLEHGERSGEPQGE